MLTQAKWQRYLHVKKQRSQHPLVIGELREYSWGSYRTCPVDWGERGSCWLKVRQGNQAVMFRWGKWHVGDDYRIGYIERPEEILRKMSTHDLMKLRLTCYRVRGPARLRYTYADIDQIKEVLATREHVPNKQERKLLRQKMAKQNRGRKS